MKNEWYTEEQLENYLLKELSENGYDKVDVKNIEDLYSNLKKQLETLNNVSISDENMQKIKNHLMGGNIFNKAKKLRDPFPIEIDGVIKHIKFLDTKEWCKNIFQVTNQFEIEGKRKNRYDVTIFFNGIPMVQIELKRPGIDVKQSFNQCIRYKHESMNDSLFDYVQIFVISNGNTTKYFCNNNRLSSDDYKQVITYEDSENIKINKLVDFRFYFLEKCQLSKLITQYMILVEGDGDNNGYLVLMRPYQVHAVEKIVNKIEDQVGDGYVWHTTGSGKTLTSFKAAQVVSEMNHVDKVLFVVDRTDLDAQTTTEYKKFGKNIVFDDIVREYNTTREVMKDLKSSQKMMVTTIQKLDNSVKRLENDEELKNKKIVLIFDECHRSQKGDMHKRIKNYFVNVQKIGFTGTPIFEKNATDLKTTEEIFGKCMHKYILPNAIKDEKVLGFSVEYWNPIKDKRRDDNEDYEYEISNDINKKEIYESDKYINHIAKTILNFYDKNTHNRKFNAMLATQGVKSAINFYDALVKLQKDDDRYKKPLKVACIFSWNPNEEQDDKNSRDDLDRIMSEYNKEWKTNFTTDNFNGYRVDLMDKVKKRSIDVVVVSDMLLTGFDAPLINTLYYDKTQKYHNLIQSFSRTNRLYGTEKDYGNVICFRPIKKDVDEAIELFSDGNASSIVLKSNYETYVKDINDLWNELVEKFTVADDIHNNDNVEEVENFVKLFKNLNRSVIFAQSFNEFEEEDLLFKTPEFMRYKDAYIEVSKRTRQDKESILNDIDFEMELVTIDKVTFEYIMGILKQMKENEKLDYDHMNNQIEKLEILKSKKELIKKFVEKYLSQRPQGDMEEVFEEFNQEEKNKAIWELIDKEELSDEFLAYAKDLEWDFSRFKTQELSQFYKNDVSILDRTKKATRIMIAVEEIYDKIRF